MIKTQVFLDFRKFFVQNQGKSIKSSFFNFIDGFLNHMRLVYLKASDEISSLLQLTNELKDNFSELELIYTVIFREYEENYKRKHENSKEKQENCEENCEEILTFQAFSHFFPKDLILLNNIFEISKNFENFRIEGGFLGFIFKEISRNFLDFFSELIFRVIL